MNKKLFTKYLAESDLAGLFNDLGWEKANANISRKPFEHTFELKAVANKQGFVILTCSPDEEGRIPDNRTRKKLDNMVASLHREHLIIYTDKANHAYLWQVKVQKPGQPARLNEVRWNKTQDTEALYQKAAGLIFTLDEEDNIGIVDVTERVAENFYANTEKVTKKFYEVFKKEHTAFIDFINGISEKVNREWYASLMLNRLMFCYFIQKKKFLDGDKDYLTNKLKQCQKKNGKDQFYNFYRDFLLKLFHDGLGAPTHSKELVLELGQIPYLNGGLFDKHELEVDNEIEIPDKAFERVFEFFNQWDWHLDTRTNASGKEINPDVIGYIFEKYINDRAEMGAYYTREDITDYISKNCIIPYLFDEVQRHYPQAFKPDGELWTMLKESGDNYIYPSVKYGIPSLSSGEGRGEALWNDLPKDVKAALDPNQTDLVEKRKCWNKPAPSSAALPSEIWREVIDRRKHYAEVRAKIEAGEITHINDFITFNLNIRQFVQDVVAATEDPKLLMHLYKSMAGDGATKKPVSILDPTCGSGAFLFAALNILEPLYEGCLHRMISFTAEEDRQNADNREHFKNQYRFFRDEMQRVRNPSHPNVPYYIYKSIILRNLYGVDIMKEAVEIAKLRLFLKLVATVDLDTKKPNMGLEPLPDVDFNIRAGNTLIGFATEDELNRGLDYSFDGPEAKPIIREAMEQVAGAYSIFKSIQLEYGDDFEDFKKAKANLDERLRKLNHELNVYLAKPYGITDLNQTITVEVTEGKKKTKKKVNEYKHWLNSHHPFHWLAEYYEILHDGGFDVIIGNPPYVEFSVSKMGYRILNYKTVSCGNLYAFVIERITELLKQDCYLGMIVPVSLNSTERMLPVRKLMSSHTQWITSFADRPSCLFIGVHQILTVFIISKSKNSVQHGGGFYHWNSVEREALFSQIRYAPEILSGELQKFKLNSMIGVSIASKVILKTKAITHLFIGKKFIVTYSGGTGGYWLRAFDEKQSSNEYKIVFVDDKDEAECLAAVINSTLFYFFWRSVSDCRHLTKNDMSQFRIDLTSTSLRKQLIPISKVHLKALKATNEKREGKLSYEQYRPAKTKPLIDEIDKVLGEHYGFTQEELDFIINYDIKYRMGKEVGVEE